MGVVMHVAGGNGIFVAVGDYGVISTSPDGFSWTRRTIGMGNNVLSVAYGNNGYVAIGWYGRLLTSPDGKVWSESILDSTIHFNSLVRINNSFVALPTFAYEKLLDTPIYEDLSDGEYFVSPNGRDWSQHSVGPDKQVTRMTYANGLYAAVCVDGSIVTSTDGVEWIARESPVDDTLRDITYADNTFVAVGHRGTFIRSLDGLSWESIPSDTLYDFYAVTHGDGRFVAVGRPGAIATSSDGSSWHMEQSGIKSTLTSIVYAENKFVAVGQSRVLVSPDGIVWNDCGFGYPLLLSSVIYADGYFTVTGADNGMGTILRSRAQEYTGIYSEKRRTLKWAPQFVYGKGMVVTRFSGMIPSGSCSLTLTDISGRRVWTVKTTIKKVMDGIPQPLVANGSYILTFNSGGETSATILPVIKGH